MGTAHNVCPTRNQFSSVLSDTENVKQTLALLLLQGILKKRCGLPRASHLTIWVDSDCDVYFIVDYNVSYIHRGNVSDIINDVLCLGGVVSREGQVNICHYTAACKP